jgi:UDP-N-acetylmuramoylalanine--D-glutamate ligase
MNPYAGKRIVVVGLGTSGFSAARSLADLGARVRVTEGSDSPALQERAEALRAVGVEVELGGHDTDELDADLAVVSPGIPPTAPIIEALRERGIAVVSEIEIAYRLARCDFLAVTGTNGKTTTTSLLASMLAEAGIPTAAAGNIGYPLIDAVASVPPDGAIAVEVSSFQLEAIEDFRPRVAVLLNIAEDHTDWHGSVTSYAAAKARIVENQRSDDVFVPNFEDHETMLIAERAPGRVVPFSATRMPEVGSACGVVDGHIVWRKTRIVDLDALPVPGVAGVEDCAAAVTAALEYGVDERAVVRALKSFRPLPHRLEVVAVASGVTYIDDSKATNPHATLTAVRGLTDVVLIAGGRAKGIDLTTLKTTVPPVVAVVALGEAADEVERVFTGIVPVEQADSMDAAVTAARRLVSPGGSVLLSPACASLDMYESYAQRGEDFARAVGEQLAQGEA